MWAGLRHASKGLIGAGALLALSACDLAPSVDPVLTPRARPDDLAAPAPPRAAPKAPSPASEDLRRYYRAVLSDAQTRGLLRTDGGGPDTPFTSDMLLRNFERIAFYSEAIPELRAQTRGGGVLQKWKDPVRIAPVFAASVGADKRSRDGAALGKYVARLARITGHPITLSTPAQANFFVLFASADDTEEVISTVRRANPNIDGATLNFIANLPRATECFVTVSDYAASPFEFGRAVAVIRSELPDLMRLACIHEELAQGLGLSNDSPYARPSIFNDDNEFALLTNHDEMLLRMLYSPRLSIGMMPTDALPIARQIARDMLDAGA